MPENLLPSSRISLTARRRKIAEACDFCRRNRVRCEAVTPCPRCVANDLTCRRSRSTPGLKKCKPAKANEATCRDLPNGPAIDATDVNDSQPVDAPVPSPQENLAWNSHRTDSTLGFIARIDVFCSRVLQTFPSFEITGSDLPLDHFPPLSANLLQETNSTACDLSPSQINHLLHLFWSHFRPHMPIIQWKDLNHTSEQISGSSPLRDAITAYSLRYIHHTALHKRVIGLNWSQFQQPIATIGMSYFQRCLSAVTQLATFAGPTISAMQCYCYLTLYLLDAENHQAAYNMVGVGLRIAESLNYMDSRNGGYRECQLFRRIWWTLIHLDFRCSRHVGKPISIRIFDLMCMRPGRESGDIRHSNGLLYHTESIRLTAAALIIKESMDHQSMSRMDTGPEHIEERAKVLSRHLHHLQRWREELPREQYFANLQFELLDTTPGSGEILDAEEEEHMEQSSVVARLSTLLLIQYHSVMVSLHRVFIQFPSHSLVPKSNPTADAHAATALNHASTVIKIAHHRMTTQDVLYGVSELYQYQWNAVITIIGFMLAYPYCHRCPAAREILVLALEIFDSAGNENAPAMRAAALTRQLRSKFDTLVQRLSFTQPISGEMPSPPSTIETRLGKNHPCDTEDPIRSEGGALPDPNEDLLWPGWADLMDFDAWSLYCDEVNGTFMDPLPVP